MEQKRGTKSSAGVSIMFYTVHKTSHQHHADFSFITRSDIKASTLRGSVQ